LERRHFIFVYRGVATAISADVGFVGDEIVWRLVQRVDAKPTLATPIMAYRGSTTRSPFITLAVRN
jgi:hypothetical protein